MTVQNFAMRGRARNPLSVKSTELDELLGAENMLTGHKNNGVEFCGQTSHPLSTGSPKDNVFGEQKMRSIPPSQRRPQ